MNQDLITTPDGEQSNAKTDRRLSLLEPRLERTIHSIWRRAKALFKSSRDSCPSQKTEEQEDNSKQEPTSYSSDQPIRSKEEDRFQRWPFARRIADTLVARTDPSGVVIGIYGPWGDGKSSVLELLRVAFHEHRDIVPVSFNPWYFKSEDQLLRSFFETLAEAVDKSLPTTSEEVGELLKRYGTLLSLASVSVGGGLLQVSPGSGLSALGDAMSTTELETLRDRVEKILKDARMRVVIMIDDIDRLDHDEIHAVFKLVKLSAGFYYTSYVLALDDEMVSASLGKRYGGGDVQAGRNFLEKIVQVPLYLPSADEIALRRLTFEGVDAALKLSEIELTQNQVDTFVRHFVDGLEPRLHTPRQAKLYGNALTFALPLLRGEVHPVDHMLIEGIRTFYPKLYKIIREHPAYFLPQRENTRADNPERNRVEQLIDEAISPSGVTDKEKVKERLLKVLFPRIGNTVYGNDWDSRWNREQRVCSEDYFHRYFRYSVPTGDVPDLAADALVREIQSRTVEEIDQAIQGIAEGNGMSKLIKKLRSRETQVDEDAAVRLSLAIARNGSLIPRERQMLISDWSFEQGALLISQLTERIRDDQKREMHARELILIASPLPFAFRCFRWFRRSEDDPKQTCIVSEDTEKEMGNILANRIKEESVKAPLYKTFGSDTPALLWAWNTYGSHKDVEAHLKQSIEKDPRNVTDLLDTYVGTAWGLESGLPSRSELQRESYDTIAKMVSPDFVAEKLVEVYGSALENPVFYHNDETPIAEQFAHQFMFIRRKILEEQKTPHPELQDPQEKTDS